MTEAPIRFLSVDDVKQIQEDCITNEGGLAGLRDEGLLTSAVMMPQAGFGGQYLHAGIIAMAAAYLFHISLAHAFHDGNKRTAVAAALCATNRPNRRRAQRFFRRLERMMYANDNGVRPSVLISTIGERKRCRFWRRHTSSAVGATFDIRF